VAVVTRFAPSPTGRLHRGHAFSALTAQALADRCGGRLLLRIEDIDATRCRPQFEEDVLADLAWLGVRWEDPVRRQSDHLADYSAALSRLEGLDVLYRCFRTRAETLAQIASAPHDAAPDPSPVGPLPPDEEARRIEEGRPFAWRLSVARALARLDDPRLTFQETGAGPTGQAGLIDVDPFAGGDIVVARKDVGFSYHLAVVVDDALQGITDVVRGHDLFEATHVQRLLQALLQLPAPVYRHHRLILRPDGKRFAKRDTAETLQSLRAAGMSPAALRADLGFAAALAGSPARSIIAP
jgi:glutamyl-Q tRNA(Asp) synthetase